ncbi:MAG: Ig-like domain-containing protein [Patescibacteria group bacterium]
MIIKSKISKKLRNSWFFLVILSLGVLWFSVVKAQGIDAGIEVVNNSIGLSSDDPRVMAARIIQIFLSLLGAVTVILIIYAGALWMMSDGNEDKISQAKRILKQSVIGLVIIFASWSITTFILNKLIDQSQGTSSEPAGAKRSALESGAGALGNCTLESVYPAPDQKEVPRNTAILVTFKEPINPTTVCEDANSNGNCDNEALKTDSVSILAETSTTAAAATVSITSDKKTLVIRTNEYLGSDTGYTDYSITLSGKIKKDGLDESIFKTCASDTYIWSFEVSNKLDLTPPKIIGVFPVPDNQKDTPYPAVERRSQGSVTLNSQPQAYQAASVANITPDNSTMPDDTEKHSNNYHGQDASFKVSYDADKGKGVLFKVSGGTNINLMAADFNGRSIDFPNYFGFTIDADPEAGDAWAISVNPEKIASTVTVGQTVYSFAGNSNGNNVEVGSSINDSASNLKEKINSPSQPNPDVEVSSLNGGTLSLRAREAGLAGDNIILKTNDSNIALSQMTGGLDNVQGMNVQGKPDQPRNSVIQIVFDEPINPMTISGSADELKDYLQILNITGNFVSNKRNGDNCSGDLECLSAKCENGKCVGDYLSGKFAAGSNYKTVEFISNNECGMNGCGDKIYCLPSDSQLMAFVNAAELFTCSSDGDCTKFGSYKCLPNVELDHKTCRDSNLRNYPLADLNPQNLHGLVDLANNSLDGDQDGFCDGPAGIPYVANSINQHPQHGDNYSWYFFINNQIKVNPPKISGSPSPVSGSPTDLTAAIKIPFDTLMMASTIKTGSEEKDGVTHNYLNLWSQTPQPLGYWAGIENKDENNPDGWPDRSDVYILHSNFNESVTYNAQAGSGLRDIYQNCFKPSAGGTCLADDTQSSCCFGSPTAENGLDNKGNCAQ